MEKSQPDIAIVTGFISSKGMGPVKDALESKLDPRSCRIIPSVPLHKAFHHPDSIVSAIGAELDAMESDNIVLIGHSYGALMALAAACRRDLRDISALFLIDGPINNNVPIKPAQWLHNLFWRHYKHREKLAAECEESAAHAASKIVTIGSKHDRVVPPESKQMIGNFKDVRMSNAVRSDPSFFAEDTDDVSAGRFEPTRGTNIYLPDQFKGHSLNKRIDVITNIIRTATRQLQLFHSSPLIRGTKSRLSSKHIPGYMFDRAKMLKTTE